MVSVSAPVRANEITIVAHDIGPSGGMERQVTELIAGCLRDDRSVNVVARTCQVEPHPRLAVHLTGGPRAPLPLAHPWFAAAAARLLRRHGSGVVHAAGAIVPGKVDIATVHFCHRAYNALGAPSRASRMTVLHRLNAIAAAAVSEASERWSYRPGRLHAIVAISQGVRREVEQCYPRLRDHLCVIPHGVDLDRFRPDPVKRARLRAREGWSSDCLVAAFVGGDWPRKGLDHAIAAVADASPWKLLVVGKGDYARYAAVAAGLGVADRVIFAGPSVDPSSQFASADAFVLPTAYETFSLVTYEAAATGLPLLVSRVSGPDELIADDKNGWFLDADPARTAALLSRLADEPELRRSMGGAARAAAMRYSWNNAVAAHLRLYDQIATREASLPRSVV